MEPCREGFPELELCETKEKGGKQEKGRQRLDAVQRRNKTHKSCFISSPPRFKVRNMSAG